MSSLLQSFLRLLIYCGLMFLCTLPMEADFLVGQSFENNSIEFAQQSLLLISVLVGLSTLAYTNNYKTFMVILALFILMHLIREFDAWFDSHFGGWFPFVLGVAAVLLGILIKNFKLFLEQLSTLRHTLGFGILLIALANLHVFTRIYGKPSNWDNIMGENYLYSVERISEEAVELIAYMMILIAVVELFIFVKKDKHNVAT